MRRLLALAALGAVAATGAALLWLAARSLDEPMRLAAPLRFKVPQGASFAHVAADLGARQVVPNPRVWVLYARWAHLAPAVKAGEYEIEPGMTPRQLLRKMVNGQVVLHAFTIVDGWRIADVLAALARNPDIVTTLGETGTKLMTRLGAPGVDAEGQFLPETYRFVSGTGDVELLRQAHEALARELDADWKERDPDIPLHSAYELLIMASIVQKESGVPQELPKIAGLYLRRLSMGMRLQADPTVIYGLGAQYEGGIHGADLRMDGPYNTYTRSGLPPTPIALAGAAAIRATARPEKGNAMYFVASPKDDGTHVFSATLAEHNAAVAAYVAHLRRKSEGAR